MIVAVPKKDGAHNMCFDGCKCFAIFDTDNQPESKGAIGVLFLPMSCDADDYDILTSAGIEVVNQLPA